LEGDAQMGVTFHLEWTDVQSSARDVFLHRCAIDDLSHTQIVGPQRGCSKALFPTQEGSGRKTSSQTASIPVG
jgi:hypothetical protein